MGSYIRESSNIQRRLEGFIVCLVLSLADPCWLLALLPELKVLYETRVTSLPGVTFDVFVCFRLEMYHRELTLKN